MSALKKESDGLIKKGTEDKGLKYRYQTNRNYLAGLLVENYLLILDTAERILKELI